jgi:hypothetical protein
MGLEAVCLATIEGRSGNGTAHLNSKDISFRGDLHFKIPFAEIRKFEAKGEMLLLDTLQGPVSLQLGPQVAQRWVLKIRYPKTLIDKLGVKEDQTVSVLGVADEEFWKSLLQRTANVFKGTPGTDSDYIFLQVETSPELRQIADLEPFLKRNGGIWVIWPKGQPHIKEDHVRAAALEARLVDVKVVSFSERLSGLKLVIPVARR